MVILLVVLVVVVVAVVVRSLSVVGGDHTSGGDGGGGDRCSGSGSSIFILASIFMNIAVDVYSVIGVIAGIMRIP